MMEKKLINNGPVRASADKHSIYPLAIYAELAALRQRADQDQLPPAAVLINEFMMGSDLDGGGGQGGSVYGRDFMIDPEDPHLPPALEPIHQHPRWPETPPPSMSWSDYLASLEP